RAGQVLSLRVAPGEVTATVQGSRRAPYQVRVGLEPFSDQVWEAVEVALAEQALYSAKLLAGELPPDLEEVFAAAGAPLFPRRFADLSLSCSCPDAAVPCKHLAASFYLLAEAFDADPFQILHWRGRDRAALLHRLRHLRDRHGGAEAYRGTGETQGTGETHGAREDQGAGEDRETGAAPPPPPVGTAPALAEIPDGPLAEALDRLWPDRFWLPPVPLPDRPATLDTAPDLLLRQLPAPPAGLGGPALAERLREAYRRFAEADRLSDRRQ